MFRLAATGLLAAAAVAGLSACGSLPGSGHPVAAAAGTATTVPATPTATAVPTPTAVPTATPAPVPTAAPVLAAPHPASRPATGGGRSGNAPAGGPNPGSGAGNTGGSGTDDSRSGGGSGGGPSAPSPKVTGLHVTSEPSCPVTATPGAPFSSPGDENVTIAWSVTGADGAALAVDQPGSYGAYGSDYPASGSLQFAFGCTPGGTTTHTYTVWPAGAHGVSRTITVSAHSDG